MTLFLFVKETYSPAPTVWSVREAFCSFGEDGVFTKGSPSLFHVYRHKDTFKIKTRDSEFEVQSDQAFSVDSYYITPFIIPSRDSDLYGEYRLGPVVHRFPVFDRLTIGRLESNDIVIPIKGISNCTIERGESGMVVSDGLAASLDAWTIKLIPTEIIVKFESVTQSKEE